MHGFRGDASPLTVVKPGMGPVWMRTFAANSCFLSCLGLRDDRLLPADDLGAAIGGKWFDDDARYLGFARILGLIFAA